MSAKPTPRVVATVCSLCDEPWDDHGEKPTTDDCIRLLKARAERAEAQRPAPVIRPYPQPYPVYPWGRDPYAPWPYRRYDTITTCGTATQYTATNTAGVATPAYIVTTATPDEGEPPEPVAA